MGATTEPRQLQSEEYRGSSLKRPLTLKARNLKLTIGPDGSVGHLESMSERRLLLGGDQLAFYGTRAGTLVRAQVPDWRLRASPSSVRISGSLSGSVEVSQTISILPAPVEGYRRSVVLKNSSSGQVRVRLLTLQDPTAAHFRDQHSSWGSLGVNAFNRATHVAMDEVASPPSARILGSKPGPSLLHMTTDEGKAADLLSNGELPEQTAGMSGQVIVLSQHDLEIPAAGSVALLSLAVYHPSKLESALSDFSRLSESDFAVERPEFDVSCSSPSVSAAAAWAVASLEGVGYEPDLLDRYEVLRVLPFVSPEHAKETVDGAKPTIGNEGFAGHASDPTRPGILESSVLLEGLCVVSLLSGEKKRLRSAYPMARRLASYLASASQGGVVRNDSSLPQGWRRRIGKGYPTGEIPEVSLAAAAALGKVSLLAARVGKREDSAKWLESSRLVLQEVRERALDERGELSLSVEDGRIRSDQTVDQAVALYRLGVGSGIDSHVVRRLLEKDFECGWGPRTVPTTNKTYYNPSYGDGQLGGYWTRAALAHAVVAYRAGLAGLGELEIESVARLPVADSPRLGGAPGEFPYWIDPQRKEAHGSGSDPVAAARFLEALIGCEVGLEFSARGLEARPAKGSRLKWLLISGLNAGRKACLFLGRTSSDSYVFAGLPDCSVERGRCFAGSERATTGNSATSAASFFTPGQTVCVGNSAGSAVETKVAFRPRDPAFSKRLSVRLQRLNAEDGSWAEVAPVRVLSPMSFEVSLGPREWGAFRLSTTS